MFKLALGGNLLNLKPLLKSVRLLPPVLQLHNESTTNNSRLSNPVIDFFLDEAAQHSKPLEPSPLNTQNPQNSPSQNEGEGTSSSKPLEPSSLNPQNPQNSPSQNEGEGTSSSKRVQMSHPWPEWMELMDKLLIGGYFDNGHPFGTSELGSKDFNKIRTACLKFARDHVDIMRFLSREDIQVVAGAGCPSLDRRVVNSGKRLRAHVGIDEGNVCSGCFLRGNCVRANVKASEDEGGRTVDVMRILLTYGLDVVIESVENISCLNKKVNESVRKLVKEVVAYSSEEHYEEQLTDTMHGSSATKDLPKNQGDWSCPKCNFLNFARNVKCLQCEGSVQERLRKLNAEQADLPLKKGDWICDKCNILNFARNTRCLLCKEKPSKRELGPGEWECDSCNYINFKQNMVCLRCDHRGPKSMNYAPPPSQPITGDNTWRHRTGPYFGHEKHSRDKWCDRLDDVDNDQDRLNRKKDKPGFFDFPDIGGKSHLSQNGHKQEMWRMEMAQHNRHAANDRRENADDKSALFQRKPRVSSFSDDEEVPDWFGL